MKTKRTNKWLNKLTKIVYENSNLGNSYSYDVLKEELSEMVSQFVSTCPEMTNEDTGYICDLIEEDYIEALSENIAERFELNYSVYATMCIIEEIEMI